MSNALDKVEEHAKALEDRADRLQADGIGGHSTMGHQVRLRAMASAMRVDKANGKVPHAFTDSYYASAGEEAEPPQFSVQVVHTLLSCGMDVSAGKISLEAFDQAAAQHGVSVDDRFQVKSALTQARWLAA